jgi:hypothetical protein
VAAQERPPSSSAISRVLWDGEALYRELTAPGSDETILEILPAPDAVRILSHTAAAPLDGYFPGDERSIAEVLGEVTSTLRIREALERVGEHDCYVIESQSKYGHIILWLDPEYEYSIVRAIVEKRGDDIWYGAKLSQVPELSEKLRAIADPTVLLQKRAVRFELSDVAVKRIQGRWIPMACNYSRQIDYGEGRSSEDVVAMTRNAIEIAPQFAANEFRPDFPDGMRVLKPGMGQIRLEWRGGQVVPAVDEEIIQQIDRDVQHNR